MNNRTFRYLLARGHGRAVLYAKSHSVELFQDAILKACLHCDSYDVQIEGTRASFLFEVIATLRNPAPYRAAVLNAMKRPRDNRHTLQHFRLAARWAAAGHAPSRRAVRHYFDPGPTYGESIALSLVDLDGLPGFLCAAARIGALLLRSRIPVDHGYLLSYARNSLGAPLVDEALARAAQSDRNVNAFAHPPALPNPKPAPQPLPASEAKLLSLTRSADPARREIPLRRACSIGLRLLRTHSPHRQFALDFLLENPSPRDVAVALAAYRSERDPFYEHSHGHSLLQYAKRIPTPPLALEILILLYESIRCSHCREAAVDEMLRLESLPPAYREECRHDANEEIRALAGPKI